MKKACFDEISYLEPLQSLFSLNRPPEVIRRKTKLSQIPLNLDSTPTKNAKFVLQIRGKRNIFIPNEIKKGKT